MNVGMLWFDNDPKTTLTAKIHQAAEHYRSKYGRMPDLCLVNPSMLAQSQASPGDGQVGKIAIRPLRSVLPGHLWIGVDEKLPTGAD
ncbi:MAG: hypothetical protein EHM81_01335 [Chloroflexi bacterium]|nr:MAG: hypothetical protein EHM81_01335 [Chloroflexota bacterium]